MNSEIYKPSDGFLKMTCKNFIWGLIGIIFGVCVNVIMSSYISKIIPTTYQAELRITLQLLLCSIFLAFVHVNVNNEFGWTWQNVTYGLFFVSFFFGTQYAMFIDIQTINNEKILKLI